MAAPPHSLRSEPGFVRWASAEGVSMVGSAVTGVVLPLVVYQITGSAAQTGALFAIRVVPYLLFGLVAGPLADRGNRCAVKPVIVQRDRRASDRRSARRLDRRDERDLDRRRELLHRGGGLGAAPEPTASLRSAVARAIRFIRGERTVATLLIVGFGNSFGFGTDAGGLRRRDRRTADRALSADEATGRGNGARPVTTPDATDRRRRRTRRPRLRRPLRRQARRYERAGGRACRREQWSTGRR